MKQWRRNATTNENCRPEAIGNGIRELRPARWYSHARQAEEKEIITEKAEAEQVKRLAFSPSASLAFCPLPLLAFPGVPCARCEPFHR